MARARSRWAGHDVTSPVFIWDLCSKKLCPHVLVLPRPIEHHGKIIIKAWLPYKRQNSLSCQQLIGHISFPKSSWGIFLRENVSIGVWRMIGVNGCACLAQSGKVACTGKSRRSLGAKKLWGTWTEKEVVWSVYNEFSPSDRRFWELTSWFFFLVELLCIVNFARNDFVQKITSRKIAGRPVAFPLAQLLAGSHEAARKRCVDPEFRVFCSLGPLTKQE